MNKKTVLGILLATLGAFSMRADVEISGGPEVPCNAYMSMTIKTENPESDLFRTIRGEVNSFSAKPLEEQLAAVRLLFMIVKEAEELSGTLKLGNTKPEIVRGDDTCDISMGIGVDAVTDENRECWMTILDRCNNLVNYCHATSDDEFNIDYFLGEIRAIADMHAASK